MSSSPQLFGLWIAAVVAGLLVATVGQAAPPQKKVGVWTLSFHDDECNCPRRSAWTQHPTVKDAGVSLADCYKSDKWSGNPYDKFDTYVLSFGLGFDLTPYQTLIPNAWQLAWFSIDNGDAVPLPISGGPSMDGPIVTVPYQVPTETGIRSIKFCTAPSSSCLEFPAQGFRAALDHVCGQRPASFKQP